MGPTVVLTPNPAYRISSAPPAVWPKTRVAHGIQRVRYGRARDNDVVIDSPLVSLYHAVVTRNGEEWTIADEGSARGTFVNGERIDERRLLVNDWVTFGGQSFRVNADGKLIQLHLRSGVPLRVRGLTVKAEAATLLNSIDLDVPAKSLVAVIGPSGSGKSTLVRSLSGLRPADSGNVLINGQDLYQAYENWRFRIGFVPQEDLVPGQLTVSQAMEYAARLRFPPDTSPQERSSRIAEVLDELKLSDRTGLGDVHCGGGFSALIVVLSTT